MFLGEKFTPPLSFWNFNSHEDLAKINQNHLIFQREEIFLHIIFY